MNDRRKSKSGSQKTVRTAQNIERVRETIVRSPQLSSSRLSQILNISQTSVVRILKQDIKMFPYKIQILQTQTDANKAMRVEFSRQMAERIENDPDLLENLIFTDEAHVELSVYMNKQNWRFWAFENPHMHIEKPKKSQRVTVLCGIGKKGCLVRSSFEDENENPLTDNQVRYRVLIQDEFLSALRSKDEECYISAGWSYATYRKGYPRISCQILLLETISSLSKQITPGRRITLTLTHVTTSCGTT